MRIALLTDGIWPFVIGGMQRHSYYLCKYLARNNVQVDLYHTAPDGSVDLTGHFDEVEMQNIRAYFIPFPNADRLPGHYIRNSRKYSRLLLESYKAQDPVDLIYAKGLTADAFIRERISGKHIPPVAVNVHGYEYYQKAATVREYFQHLMLRPSFRFVNLHADFIYSYGAKISDIIRRVTGRTDNIIEIPTGIESDLVRKNIRPTDKYRKFVFLGRYEIRKGIRELSKAVSDLLVRADFEFHFIGNIPMKERISSSKVIYHGLLAENHAILDIVGQCDVLVCPSYSEGMPNVILEGMASGCAIIATDVGAVSQMVDSSNGWIIKPGSESSLMNALEAALKIDTKKLDDMKKKSISKTESSFLWNVIIRDVIRSFERIVERPSRNSNREG